MTQLSVMQKKVEELGTLYEQLETAKPEDVEKIQEAINELESFIERVINP